MSENIDLKRLVRKRGSNMTAAPWMEKFLSDESFDRFVHCGDYLVMLEDEKREQRKLLHGFYCKQRLCSACAWRKAVKTAQCVSAISQALVARGKVMLMVTLTVPNVPGDKLRETIQHLGKSWRRLMHWEKYKCWRDNIRKVEVTYNQRRNDYHPHLHLIVYVNKGYFKGSSYISQKQLLEDWREVTGQLEITQVDLRRCRDKGHTNAVLEVSKYTVKASDYLVSESVFDIMYMSLKQIRLLTYSGECSGLRDAYQAGELSEFEETDLTVYTYRVVYIWQRCADVYDYVETSVSDYIPDEDAETYERKRELKRLAEAHDRVQRQKDWNRFDALRTWANEKNYRYAEIVD